MPIMIGLKSRCWERYEDVVERYQHSGRSQAKNNRGEQMSHHSNVARQTERLMRKNEDQMMVPQLGQTRGKCHITHSNGTRQAERTNINKENRHNSSTGRQNE